MNRATSLAVILGSGLSLYLVIFIVDKTDIFEKSHELEYQAGVNSIKKGIDNYVIDKGGQLPGDVANQGSGTYEVCKQGMPKCPEGSISLDVLVNEGYLKEIPTSYLAETDALTGYKLAYDSNKAVVNIQNEDVAVAAEIKSKGVYTFISSQDITNNFQFENYDIIIDKNVTINIGGNHKFASFTNYGEVIVTTSALEIWASHFNNFGRINADNVANGNGADLKFMIFHNFVNTGLITSASTAFKLHESQTLKGGDITIISKYLNLKNGSLQAFSLNGGYGKLDLSYFDNMETITSSFLPYFSEVKTTRIK